MNKQLFEDFMKGRFPGIPLNFDEPQQFYYHDMAQIAWVVWQGATNKGISE